MNFASCPHEPCLCAGNFNGHDIMFLRQVDDFAIASPTPEIASLFLDKLDKCLKQKLKHVKQAYAFKVKHKLNEHECCQNKNQTTK